MTLVLKSGYSFDPDASTYIDAVETADGEALETGVRVAINDFVLGCKQDGIWDAIKASCILAGARTLDGALVPLVGTAPTKQGTEVDWNYNRVTGLQGNGTNNYLDSNRAGNADLDTNSHISIYNSTVGSGYYIGANGDTEANQLQNGVVYFQNRSVNVATGSTGFYGAARTGSVLTGRASKTNATSTASVFLLTSPTATYAIFARNISGAPAGYTNARLAFYSIGESLDLAKLDTRVSNLITAIGGAI